MSEQRITGTHFFSGKSIGKSLKEVAVDMIKTESDNLISRWFHSDMDTDLFTWVDQGQNIIKQQISFNGQVVEWNCLEGIKTGVVVESDMNPVPQDEAQPKHNSETIMFDANPQPKSVGLALEILQYMEVDAGFHQQLVGNFKDPQNIQTMSPKLFVERFGLSLKNYNRQDQGFWDNLKKRLQTIFKK
jgi:hypothetical protein